MKQLRNAKENKKYKTTKENVYMNLGDEIEEKFRKFTMLFRNNNEEIKNKEEDLYLSKEINDDDYYETFLKHLKEENNIIENDNSQKLKILKKKKKKNEIEKESLNEADFHKNNKTTKKHQNSKVKEQVKFDISNLTPIKEEKQKEQKKNESIKLHPILLKTGKTKSMNSIKSKENITNKNSYILNDMKQNKTLVLKHFNLRNTKIKNSLTPVINLQNNKLKVNFSSIKSKKNNNKTSLITGIKNSQSEKLKKKISLKDEKLSVNSLEEASGINLKQNHNFNPKKINIENIKSLSRNEENLEEKKDISSHSHSENSYKIIPKKRCLFCCLPVY